jgi:hypothetical protein
MENAHDRSRRVHTSPYHFFSRSHLLSSTLLLLVLATLLPGCRPSRSEKHTLLINGTVHVYRTETPPTAYPGSDFIAVLGPQDKTEVRQIVHKSNYVAVKIRLSDGREGWVFSGENIELR